MIDPKELDKKFEKLKQYSEEKNTESLVKRIYDLRLNDEFLSTLDHKKLLFIHVKLHNSFYYKKPFAPKKDIKKVHDRVALLLPCHTFIDDLDLDL